jgi:hypothetical protein
MHGEGRLAPSLTMLFVTPTYFSMDQRSLHHRGERMDKKDEQLTDPEKQCHVR